MVLKGLLVGQMVKTERLALLDHRVLLELEELELQVLLVFKALLERQVLLD